MPVTTATDVSGRTAPPADEPVGGETRGAKPIKFSDPSADPDWHPNPEDHPARTSVRLTPREAPWRSDSAQDVGPIVTEEGRSKGILRFPPRDGGPTLRVAYLFSGVSRKASIASELKHLCMQSGTGLNVEEIDIYNGGSAMDLLDANIQSELEARIKDAQFDVVIISPPCSTWSRACQLQAASRRQT